MKYDKTKHAELAKEKSDLEKELEVLSSKLHDQYHSDEWGGEKAHAKMVDYQVNQHRHAELSRKLDRVDVRWQAYEDLKPVEDKKRYLGSPNDAIRRWLMDGCNGLESWEKDIYISEPTPDMIRANPLVGRAGGDVFDPYALLLNLQQKRSPQMAAGDPVRSDLDSGDDSALGLAAPETWARGVVEALRYSGAVAQMCRSINTSDGNDYHQNALDTADEEGGTIVNQSQTAGTGIPPTTHDQIGPATDIVFKAYIRHSNWLSQRLETMQDIHFDVGMRIMREMTRRMGRGWNNWFTNGSGTNSPEGLINACKYVLSGADTLSVTFPNLLDLEYAIDLAYLEGNEGFPEGFMDEYGGSIGFMMNRNIERILRLARQPNTELPLWLPSQEVGMANQRNPGTIMGYPYRINNHLPDGVSTSPGEVPLLFGNFGHYCIRNVAGMQLFRFWDTQTAAKYSVQFIGFSRRDGRTLGPLKTVPTDKLKSSAASGLRCDAIVGLAITDGQ